MSGDGRRFLTVDEPDGWAVWITDAGLGGVEPGAGDPVGALLPAGISHLLAADDALNSGRWGAHITLCGQQVRDPNVEHDDARDCLCVRYCPACACARPPGGTPSSSTMHLRPGKARAMKWDLSVLDWLSHAVD